jgi:hypothetical protein
MRSLPTGPWVRTPRERYARAHQKIRLRTQFTSVSLGWKIKFSIPKVNDKHGKFPVA